MKKVILVIVGFCITLVLLIAVLGMYKFNYLASQPGYDVDGNKIKAADVKNDFDIIEVLSQSCQSDDDCITPMSYAMQSVCPYDSVCIKSSCTVICPHPFTGTSIDISED